MTYGNKITRACAKQKHYEQYHNGSGSISFKKQCVYADDIQCSKPLCTLKQMEGRSTLFECITHS